MQIILVYVSYSFKPPFIPCIKERIVLYSNFNTISKERKLSEFAIKLCKISQFVMHEFQSKLKFYSGSCAHTPSLLVNIIST